MEEVPSVETSDVNAAWHDEQHGVFDKTVKMAHYHPGVWLLVPSRAGAPTSPLPLPFHNIMEPVETWDNIWQGNGKDNGRLWTTFIPSLSPLSRVWVAAALLNHVWNFWLQRQHTYVFFSRSLHPAQGNLRLPVPREECVTITFAAQLFFFFFHRVIKLPWSGCFSKACSQGL